MLLVCLSLAWVAGIFLGELFDFPLFLIFTGLIPLPLLFFRKHSKQIVLTSLCLFAFFGGAGYFRSSLPAVDESSLRFYNDRGTVEIEGLVNRDPEVRDKTTHLYLSADSITLEGQSHTVTGTVLMFVPGYQDYSYGDVLRVEGVLETPTQFDDFDYRGYLAHRGVYSTMLYPEIEILETGRGLAPLGWVYSLRNSLSQTLIRVLPEPQASLAQGVVLGIRGNIPLPVREDFNRTGTAHLLAISGLHLSIVAGIVLSLGVWLFGRRGYVYVWLALGAIWLYALITGMQAPVVRAAIMASLFLAADLLGRQRRAFPALAFTAAIMVAVDPQVLWTASFQMSFAAIAGLVFIFPPLRAAGRKMVTALFGEDGVAASAAGFLVDSFSVSLGAIVAVWPLVAYYFGVVSPVAPLATLFALPALPAVIITGALAGVVGLAALPVAQVLAWPAWLFLSYLLLVVDVFAVFPFLEGGTVITFLVWGYYSVLVPVIWLINRRRGVVGPVTGGGGGLKSGPERSSGSVFGIRVKRGLVPLLLTAVLVSATAATMPDEDLHVSFLDVGQGDAILIQKGSRQVLVDGGPSPQAIALGLGRKMPFWDRTIDLVVLTHPSADHVTGLVEVMERYEVGQVLYPDLDFSSPVYEEWLALLEEKGIESTPAQCGQQIDLGSGVIIEVLNPPMPLLSGTESDVDNNGVVLHLEAGEVSFLLTADTMWQAEYELISRRADLNSTVLKLGHHGSATSTSAGFLAVVDPQLAVIQVGDDNPYGHPAPEVIARLEERIGAESIYRTDEHGTIEFITDGDRLWVKTER